MLNERLRRVFSDVIMHASQNESPVLMKPFVLTVTCVLRTCRLRGICVNRWCRWCWYICQLLSDTSTVTNFTQFVMSLLTQLSNNVRAFSVATSTLQTVARFSATIRSWKTVICFQSNNQHFAHLRQQIMVVSYSCVPIKLLQVCM